MQDIVDPERLADIQAILAHWETLPVRTVEAFQGEQRVFKITTAGPAFILKDISDAPDLTRLEFTRSVLVHLVGAGIRVAPPLLSRAGRSAVLFQGRFFLLSEFIEAGQYPTAPEQKAELFYNTGQAIARLHHALASYPDTEISSKTWREDLAGRAAEWIAALSERLPEPQAAIVKRVGEKRGAAIKTALQGLPEQLIHRDCHPGNILVDGTRVIGFIDCDHFCIGPRLFDLAYYAVHHVKWVTDDQEAAQHWLNDLPHLLSGYRSLHDLSSEEVAALPYAMLAYHLLLSHWFMGLPLLEPIALEVQALDWIDRHLDAIVETVT